MPEEINRLLTDQIADLLFTPSADGNHNLEREGVCSNKVHLVGNVMIDSLVRMLPQAHRRIPQSLPDSYILVTLHRPSNVDDLSWLAEMFRLLAEISREVPVLFPVHPRSLSCLLSAGLAPPNTGQLQLLDPLPYLEFLGLQTKATVVVTDSGGIQEETTFLNVPCLTVRENTERPITVEMGTNILVGRDLLRLRRELENVLCGRRKQARVPPLWDGCAAERIAARIAENHWHADHRNAMVSNAHWSIRESSTTSADTNDKLGRWLSAGPQDR